MLYMKNFIAAAIIACAGTAATAASVTVYNGSASDVTGSTDPTADALRSDTIQYMIEKTDYTLPVKQVVNQIVGFPVESGTVVNVYLVFLNAVSRVSQTAGLEFDGEILGLVYGDTALNNGNNRYGGTGYGVLDGIETGAGDSASFVSNRLTVTLNSQDRQGDFIRVLTSTSLNLQNDNGQPTFDDEVPPAVPLPASGVLFGFGLAGLAAMRQFRGKS